MNENISKMASPLDEQLVAYLDGELDAESSRGIEELLASDANVRDRLAELQRTWDLLDDLNAAPVSGRFTQSTLEMVAVAAGKEVDRALASAPRRRRRRLLITGGSLLAAVAAGLLTAAMLTPNANQQLLQDLPILQNLDDYRQIEDIEFLRLLRAEALEFPPEKAESPQVTTAMPADLAERRQLVESMSPSEQERFLRLYERFDALGGDEQKRVRLLHDTILQSADAEQLLRVMGRYCQWLKTLPTGIRAELAELDRDARLRSVKNRLLNERAGGGAKSLSDAELKALQRWMDAFAAKHDAEFRAMLPLARQPDVANWPSAWRRVMLIDMARHWQPVGPGKSAPLLSVEDLSQLRQQLSPETQAWLSSKQPGQQWQIVAGWMRNVIRQRFARGSLPKPGDDLLIDFFEQMPAEERDGLLALPGEEMQRELLRRYLRHTRPTEKSPRRADGPSRENRSGDHYPPKKRRPDEVPKPQATGKRP